MGSPDFAVPALAALAASGHQIACVYSQPPRPSGRGQAERPTPVHAWASRHGLEVRTPARLRDAADQADFAALEADLAVVAAYGLILPRPVLDAPKWGCLNLHASRLPRWRGAAPIQRAIEAGDAETGVDVMVMEAGLDTGPVILRHIEAISDHDTGGALHDRLSAAAARLVVPAVEGWVSGTLQAQPQPLEGVTYAAKIDRAELRIDWTRPAAEVERKVRAMAPQPGLWTMLPDGARLRVLLGQVAPGVHDGQPPGTLLDGAMTVACGQGALRLLRVQREGRGVVDAEAFARAGGPRPGTVLN